MEGRKIIKLLISWAIVVIIVGYSSFVLYGYMRGPRIIISSPESGFSTTTPLINIVGRVVHANAITINDAESPSDLNGNFQSRLLLADGYNIMKVTAKDRYGRVAEKTIEMNLVKNGMLNMEDGMGSGMGTSTRGMTTATTTNMQKTEVRPLAQNS